jgi:hypothetical protein
MWMNGPEVEWAAQRLAGHSTLGPASKFLNMLMDSVNAQSDGWHSWPAPGRAASKLQDLIQQHTTNGCAYPKDPDQPTMAEVRKTITPIKSMVTKQRELQKRYGNTFEFDVAAAMKEAGIT